MAILKDLPILNFMKRCGFLYGDDVHYLDHIAPLCALLQIPLFVTNDHILKLAHTLYPELKVKELPSCEYILKEFDFIFSCLPKALLNPLFFLEEFKLNKKLHSIWVPHGQSDKDNLSGLKDETHVLTYGKKMSSILNAKKIKAKQILCGNYRAYYFEKHKTFYNTIFPKEKKTSTLFAPSWDEKDIRKQLTTLLENQPKDSSLFVKLHPNTIKKGSMLDVEEKFPKITFLTLPTIYPILSKMTNCTSTISSISYDWLYFTAKNSEHYRKSFSDFDGNIWTDESSFKL